MSGLLLGFLGLVLIYILLFEQHTVQDLLIILGIMAAVLLSDNFQVLEIANILSLKKENVKIGQASEQEKLIKNPTDEEYPELLTTGYFTPQEPVHDEYDDELIQIIVEEIKNSLRSGELAEELNFSESMAACEKMAEPENAFLFQKILSPEFFEKIKEELTPEEFEKLKEILPKDQMDALCTKLFNSKESIDRLLEISEYVSARSHGISGKYDILRKKYIISYLKKLNVSPGQVQWDIKLESTVKGGRKLVNDDFVIFDGYVNQGPTELFIEVANLNFPKLKPILEKELYIYLSKLRKYNETNSKSGKMVFIIVIPKNPEPNFLLRLKNNIDKIFGPAQLQGLLSIEYISEYVEKDFMLRDRP